jgi:tetratricopeptide (TPR) repeat protein
VVYFLNRNKKSSPKPENPITVLEQKPQNLLNELARAPTPRTKESPETDCYTTLLKLSGAVECNEDCFREKLIKKKELELVQVLEESWGRSKPKSNFGRFNEAVDLAGIGHVNGPHDLLKAEKLLEDLIADDPSNSYPKYFLAVILARNDKMQKAKKFLIEAKKQSEYQPYVLDISLKMRLATLDDPSTFLLGSGVWSSLPLPSMRSLEELHDVYPDALLDLGRKMIAKTIEVQGRFVNYLWSPVEHQIGLSLINKVAPDEAQKSLSYEQWMNLSKDDSADFIHMDDEKNCDIETFKENLQKIKTDLKPFLTN